VCVWLFCSPEMILMIDPAGVSKWAGACLFGTAMRSGVGYAVVAKSEWLRAAMRKTRKWTNTKKKREREREKESMG